MPRRLPAYSPTGPRLLAIGALALALLGVLPNSSTAWAKSSDLPAAKVRKANKATRSYDLCRRDALARLKDGSLTKDRFETALSVCRENFPGADLYVNCKKQAVRTAAAGGNAGGAAEQCKRYLLATQFDPAQPIPYFLEAGQLYFAGIGMNRSLPIAALKPPNFTCERLGPLMKSPERALYLLFGNHPKAFGGFGELGPTALKQRLKMPRSKGKKPIDIAGFGRMFGDPAAESASVFFPVGSCDFEAEGAPLYTGLSAYYLLETGQESATPYFGIAYYQADQKKITTKKLVQTLAQALGPNYTATPKNSQVTFIAAAPIMDTDEEKDPRNLCLNPRNHRLLAIVQGQKAHPERPDYALVANVKNLCDFGDRLARQLAD